MGSSVATKKITIEVEVPEDIDKEAVERLARTLTAWFSMIRLRNTLTPGEIEDLFREVEEAVWKRHQQS